MVRSSSISVIALLASASVVLGVRHKHRTQVVFQDDFDQLDLDTWDHELTAGGANGANWEFQYYCNNRSNSYVEGGILHIQPTLTADLFGDDGVTGVKPSTLDLWGSSPADSCTSNAFYGCARSSNLMAKLSLPPVQSASIRTYHSFSFKYGRMEVRAKLPSGDWIKPTISILPQRNAYGKWPASGEVTVIQSRGNPPGYGEEEEKMLGAGSNAVSSVAHWGPHWSNDAWMLSWGEVFAEEGGNSTTFVDGFHTYGLFWDEETMYTYVDDDSNRMMEINFYEMPLWDRGNFGNNLANPWAGADMAAPFDQRFYIQLGVSVGGLNGYFPDGLANKPWENASPQAAIQFFNDTETWYPTWHDNSDLQIDSITVWQDRGSYSRSSFNEISNTGGFSNADGASTASTASSASVATGALVGLCVGILATVLVGRLRKTRQNAYEGIN